MNFLKNILFIFLLTSSLLYSANAAQNYQGSSTPAIENANAEFKQSKDGIILGGELTAFGIKCLFSAATTSTESKENSNKKSTKRIADAVGDAAEAGALTFMGVIYTLIGLPILIYSGYKYKQQAKKKSKDDDQQIALDRNNATSVSSVNASSGLYTIHSF